MKSEIEDGLTILEPEPLRDLGRTHQAVVPRMKLHCVVSPVDPD